MGYIILLTMSFHIWIYIKKIIFIKDKYNFFNKMDKMLNKDNITTVLYHDECADGFGSAFICWLYYKQHFGLEAANKITYTGCKYQKDKVLNFNHLAGQNVLLCDFSYKYEQLNEIIRLTSSFMILDHHKTAKEDLVNIVDDLKVFDMNRSGVGITWDYFFPEQPLPLFLQHIQDRDLWQFKLEGTNEFIIYLFEQNFTFQLFESFLLKDNLTKAIETGKGWLQYKQIVVSNIAKEARPVLQLIDNKLLLVYYVNNVYGFTSDLGAEVFKHFPLADFSAVYDHKPDDNITKFSLRSTDEREDVSKIAASFNGGGHRNASGLTIANITFTLPGQQYNLDILSLLRNKECRTNGPMAKKGIYSYILFKLDKMIEEEYVEFLRRKLPKTYNLVFLIDSEYHIYRDNIVHKISYDGDLLKIIESLRKK